MTESEANQRLFRIRVVHTIAWVVFAGAILAIPLFTAAGRWRIAAALSLLVWCEVIVVVASGFRCPLTPLAARYTTDRRANFDIFLPEWLARWNKLIFGTLFVLSQLYLWLNWPSGS